MILVLEETARERPAKVQKVLCEAQYHVTQKEIANCRGRLAREAKAAPEVQPQELR